MALLKQQFRSDWRTILGWSLVMAGLTWYLASMYWVFERSGMLVELERLIREMPPSVQALMGGQGIFSMGTFEGYIEQVVYSGFVQLLLAIYVCIYVPSLISREVEQRSVEFLLSMPLQRRSLVVSRWSGFVVQVLLVCLLQWVATTAVAGEASKPAAYLLASLNLFLVLVTVGTMALLVSVFIDDYYQSVGASVTLGIGLFFANAALAERYKAGSWTRFLIPFSHIDVHRVIGQGKTPGSDMAILAIMSLALLSMTIVAFERKEIAA
ncbi:MAG TPA: ABC transporter permease subunit [Firmicutes bacterium]|nr:ABC transporter permease subunit [Candidatus Fermentithermobacillaceae bacterium]